MNDFFYYLMNFFPYLVAIAQCIMYIFVIILLAKVTKPLVAALKAYAVSKNEGCCTCVSEEVIEVTEPTTEATVEAPKAE
ncbi:MAG: hypothetical protein RSF33_01035 [Hydrogenoanaerobacterium sp.]